ncbi:hypothetical protein LCGC14_1571680 [marine sediment metagenome]|uniref:Uncharacterized protein n=1 Tax=marine sediment metagenome TaxID=412755 RepID=A0A0F9J5R5_9ZZZZ
MKSRTKRWAKAIAEAQEILEEISDLAEKLNGAVDNVRSIQEEYEDWHGNLPEGLQESTTTEKLQAVVDLELDFDISIDGSFDFAEITVALEEAELTDLPLGFGRD